MQHVSSDYQIELKQQSILEMMGHADVQIGEVIAPLKSHPWGYRRKARLGVKYVLKKERLLIGFRERNKPYLADMQSCHILIEAIGQHLPELMQLITEMDARQTIAQIEVAADDEHCVLVFRHLEPLSESDVQKLTNFAKASGLWIQLQPQGPDSMTALFPVQQELAFKPMVESDIRIGFKASDFTQVNNDVNQQMVKQALGFLDLQPDDRVLDLFCGLGNFTLPIAQRAAHVTGVEGDELMVRRARDNALQHGIHNTEYHVADLTKIDPHWTWMKKSYDKILLDPPRSGAFEIIRDIARLNPSIIVYVSCQPSSLVRDAKVLQQSGYRLAQMGLMDMFPQTAHIESMAVFKN